jgi:hypothetical protein
VVFLIYDVSQSVADRPETLGSKEKFWLTPRPELGLGDDLHLFKIGREGTGENWAEKVACEIAKVLGIPCAEYHLATCKGHNGVLSPRFLPRRSPFIPANTLFSTVDREYDGSMRFKQRKYKLVSALAIIRSFSIEQIDLRDEGPLPALSVFIGYLIFDALIGNTDRHHENWGITILGDPNRLTFNLAPSFDHASSLGREHTMGCLSPYSILNMKNRSACTGSGIAKTHPASGQNQESGESKSKTLVESMRREPGSSTETAVGRCRNSYFDFILRPK